MHYPGGLKLAAAIIFAWHLAGCAVPSSKNQDTTELKQQILELQKTAGTQAARIEELNNKILLLTDRIDGGAETSMSARPAQGTQTVPKKKSGPAVAIPEAGVKEMKGVERLYYQAQSDAQLGQMTSLQRNVELMLKGYKESPLTINALFLLGETFYEQKQYLKAAEQFDRLYKTFPDGNKAVPALFKLGLCYEQLGKTNEAKQAFNNVVSIYPGSREAMLAEKHIGSGQGSPGQAQPQERQ
jgi:tol-pal system protein YbgF